MINNGEYLGRAHLECIKGTYLLVVPSRNVGQRRQKAVRWSWHLSTGTWALSARGRPTLPVEMQYG